MLAEKKPSLQIKWTHIGDGPLFDRLQNQAHIAFTNLKNVSFDFKGRLPNKSVKKFYTSEPIDIFINTSESEGIPVSIMEAMSYEVPSIAPNIGGISSLLNKNCGVLLDKNPSIDDIKSALENFIEKSKTQKVRSQAKNVVLSKYNSQRNYTKFIQTIYKGIQGDSRRITKHT
jgi:glycosyltransferase involved in cell wall biosynthesis